jgi:DNA-directed RNA polymerase specialized sigma24 family protein
MAEITLEVRQLLEKQPWSEIVARLLLYADNKMRRRVWRGSLGGDPPEGIQAEDLVQTVIEKVLSGGRRWDPDRHPDLLGFLMDALDSEISNLVQSFENRRMKAEASVDASVLEQIDGATPETQLLDKERESESEDFILGLLEFVKADHEVQQVVETIMGGVAKRAEIAQRLGVAVTEIDARKKRLFRRVEEYRAKRVAMATPRSGGTSHA